MNMDVVFWCWNQFSSPVTNTKIPHNSRARLSVDKPLLSVSSVQVLNSNDPEKCSNTFSYWVMKSDWQVNAYYYSMCWSLALLPVRAWRYLLSNKKIMTSHSLLTPSRRPFSLLIPVMRSWCIRKGAVAVLKRQKFQTTSNTTFQTYAQNVTPNIQTVHKIYLS